MGQTPTDMESINELIKFDHVYSKTNPTICKSHSDTTTQSSSQKNEEGPGELQQSTMEDVKIEDLSELMDFDFTDFDFENLLCASEVNIKPTADNVVDDITAGKIKLEDGYSTESINYDEISAFSVYDIMEQPSHTTEDIEVSQQNDLGYGSGSSDLGSPEDYYSTASDLDLGSPCCPNSLSEDKNWQDSYEELFPALI